MHRTHLLPVTEEHFKVGFPAVSGPDPAVLLLGSLPGDESLRRTQYYGHKYNAFWRIMGELFAFDPGAAYETRLAQLCSRRIALWDVLAEASRSGSLDTAIRGGVPNPIDAFAAAHPGLRAIGCNGTAAFNLLKKHHRPLFDSTLEIRRLPSTSPAAALYSYSEKLHAFRNLFHDFSLID